MNRKQILLSLITFDFLALTGYAIYQHGYLGIFALAAENSATILLTVDLLLALVMVVAWMWVDANRHGLRVWPYLLISAVFGSAGPLLYLIRRESQLAGKP